VGRAYTHALCHPFAPMACRNRGAGSHSLPCRPVLQAFFNWPIRARAARIMAHFITIWLGQKVGWHLSSFRSSTPPIPARTSSSDHILCGDFCFLTPAGLLLGQDSFFCASLELLDFSLFLLQVPLCGMDLPFDDKLFQDMVIPSSLLEHKPFRLFLASVLSCLEVALETNCMCLIDGAHFLHTERGLWALCP
jgi:hypothetical protein